MPPTTPPMPMGDTMSQAEVEQLLVAAERSEAAASDVILPAALPAQVAPETLPRHDFPAPTFFSELEYRSLRERHEDYIRALAARLSGHFRLECGLQLTKLEPQSFKNFLAGVTNPTYLTMFRLEPLSGICLLDLSPRLALTLVDRELGGPGVYHDEPRELTKLEGRLVSRVVELIVSEWCRAWSDQTVLRAALLGHETCPRFIHTHEPEQMLLLLGLEIRVGDLVEKICIAIPLTIIEALVAGAGTDRQKTESKPKPQPAQPRWNAAMDDLTVRLTAEWHGVEITARQLTELKPGDVLPIAPGTAERIQISLEAAPKFIGSLGTAGSNWAVKIAEILRR